MIIQQASNSFNLKMGQKRVQSICLFTHKHKENSPENGYTGDDELMLRQ
jgi:hypothetical protein